MGRKQAKRILSKRVIREIARRYRESDQDVADLAEMANEYRKVHRQGKKPQKKKKRKVKTHLKPTDHLTPKQWARIYEVVKTEPTKHMSRAVLNRMLLITLVESGLRASEVCNLRLRSLPSYHGQQSIEVLDGKGKKDRTVGISDSLMRELADYVHRYHAGHDIDNYLFRSEQGGRLSPAAVRSKVKRIGMKAGIWIYVKNDIKKTKLSPHKFRHTMATHLMDTSGNAILVKDNLGHKKIGTTDIYMRSLPTKLKESMNKMSKQLWSKVVTQTQKTPTLYNEEKRSS